MTDAFTKYAEVVAIPNKEAAIVANKICINCICRFGSPVQIYSNRGKKFINSLSNKLPKLLEIKQTFTSPSHLQCNLRSSTKQWPNISISFLISQICFVKFIELTICCSCKSQTQVVMQEILKLLVSSKFYVQTK